MESIRQKRINSLLQHDLAEVFRALAAAEFPGTLITVSKIRVTPDLGLAPPAEERRQSRSRRHTDASWSSVS